MKGNHGPVITAVLSEAMREFGNPRTWDCELVTAWVRRRVLELSGKATADVRPFHPRGFSDAKQRQSGDGDE